MKGKEITMCGISGWLSYQRDLSQEQLVLDAMTETVASRGPDDRGVWIASCVGFGHRRLAVVDLVGGTQPLTIPSGGSTVAITYCGEVYNFKDLRHELKTRGHEFASACDTEVVLHAYLEWGDAFAERLDGMYGFAVWDGRSRSLLLVRDRLGIKPLYYYPTPDGVVFGSEPKVILANPLVTPSVDLAGLRQLFAPFKVPGAAIWSGMREVRPGTIVRTTANGISERTYWNLCARFHSDDQSTSVATVRRLLASAVRRQLVTDVSSCVLLSGGLDSSAIAALASKASPAPGTPVRTFSIDVLGAGGYFTPDPLRETADGPFAQVVAHHLDSHHTNVVLECTQVADPHVRLATVSARDAPGLGDLDQSLYLLFQAIRNHATVALSGEGADEIFGGYLEFHQFSAQTSPTFPWTLRQTRMPDDVTETSLTRDLVGILRMVEFANDTYSAAVRAAPSQPDDSEQDRLVRQSSYLYLTHFLPLLLERKDRMSMATGLEVRVPFCDQQLVEYVFNVPWSLKTFDGREKSLLRAAATDLLPEAILRRKKSVYPCIHDEEYLGELQTQVKDVLADRGHSVFDLYDRRSVERAASVPVGRLQSSNRILFERVLETYTWLEVRHPTFHLS